MNHVVLLGDSVFDNAAYVRGGPAVYAQLKGKLPEGWRATLSAVDGSITSDIRRQLQNLPEDATHLVISAGGNDALQNADILMARAEGMAEALNKMADAAGKFERSYEEMLEAVLSRRLPTAVSTIYYPRFADARLQRIAVVALSVFNDAIIRNAFMRGLPLLDLRLICNEDADYANEIEPSVRGGEKITDAILKLLTGHDFKQGRSQTFI